MANQSDLPLGDGLNPRAGWGGKRPGAGRPAKTEILRAVEDAQRHQARILQLAASLDAACHQALALLEAGQVELAQRVLRQAAYPRLGGGDDGAA